MHRVRKLGIMNSTPRRTRVRLARFTGLAGEVQVHVTGHGSDGALEIAAVGADGLVLRDESVRLPTLRPSGMAVPAARPAPGTDGSGPGLTPGEDGLLAIRPTGIYLLRSDAETPHLTGTVADVAFRGRGYEYAIDLPALGRLTGIFGRHRAERGDSVGLRLDPEGCHLFRATAKPDEKDATSPAPALTA